MAETRADAPGGDKKIMGLEPKTFVIVAIVVVVGGYLYIKSKQQQQGQGQGGGPAKVQSPTGTSREDINVWVRDHHGHKGHK